MYVDLNVFLQLNSIILCNLIQTKYWRYKEKGLEKYDLHWQCKRAPYNLSSVCLDDVLENPLKIWRKKCHCKWELIKDKDIIGQQTCHPGWGPLPTYCLVCPLLWALDAGMSLKQAHVSSGSARFSPKTETRQESAWLSRICQLRDSPKFIWAFLNPLQGPWSPPHGTSGPLMSTFMVGVQGLWWQL